MSPSVSLCLSEQVSANSLATRRMVPKTSPMKRRMSRSLAVQTGIILGWDDGGQEAMLLQCEHLDVKRRKMSCFQSI